MAAPHYAGLAGAPLVIYGVRKLITMFFDWRITQQQAYVGSLSKQRESKIVDLKKATRYDSTQELLQKYGGAGKPSPSKQPQQAQQGTKRKIIPSHEPQRTGLPPPPTANIPGRNLGSAPSTPLRPNVDTSPPTSARMRSPLSAARLSDSPANIAPEEPGFAPNAFSHPPPSQAPPAYDQQPRWYDRFLDVLLGEDETLAKNRLALICSNCRLVNGQAPPGVKSVEELGRWRCGGCGAWNGVETATAKAVKEMGKVHQEPDKGNGWEKVSKGQEETEKPSPEYVDGVSDAIQDALEEAEEGPEGPREISAKEIPDSEDDEVGEDDSEKGDNSRDSEVSADSGSKRVTRSASKQTKKGKR